MDKFKQLMCIKGLIMSMDEELYKHFQKDNLPDNLKAGIINSYYDSIYDFLKEKVKTNESTS